MKLLVVTQIVDKEDTTLGFFHGWLISLASQYEKITVICLKKGESDLPKNVSVYSLGKERGVSKFSYVKNFYKYIWQFRYDYQKVFVHMNQEYVLLGGLFWKMFGKKVFFWRNHPYGNILTRMAILFSSKVFCTSESSFTARFRKTLIMPAGIDTTVFKPVENVMRKKHSVCMVGRISPIKNIDIALHAIHELFVQDKQVTLSIIGPVPKVDEAYFVRLKRFVDDMSLSQLVHFLPAVSQKDLPEIYSAHEICLNLTTTGSFDKTIIEASACGTIPLSANSSLAHLLPAECITEYGVDTVARSISTLLFTHRQADLKAFLDEFVKSQSLSVLMEKLFKEMQ